MRSILLALVVGVLLATFARAGEAPKVVASIKPVHSLVAAVMQGVGTPALLLEGHVSPHTYVLKPSDARALEAADLIVRIGPDLETFLTKSLRALDKRESVVDLVDTEGLTILEIRDEGVFADGHDEEEHDEHSHDHAHSVFDMHLWLDPANAKLMTVRIAGLLEEIDPTNAAQYQRNATRMTAELDALASDIETMLEPLSGKGFIVFHDAYHYFEHRFGLEASGSISVNPQNPAGAATIAEIEHAVTNEAIKCAFIEPQFSPKLIEAIAGARLRIGTLDPIGANIDAGPDHYQALMRETAGSFRECLSD